MPPVPPLARLVATRLLALIPILLGLSLASFALVHVIPGDPALVMMGGEGTPQAVEELRRQLGLDRPLPVRYWEWLTQIARGDLGTSLYNKTRVSEELLWRMPTTLALVALALTFAVAIGVPAGLLSAAFRNSWIDHAARLLTLVSLSLPSFWLGLMLIILFSLWLDLLPIVGYEPITRGVWKNLPYLILPSASLGTYLAALLTRLTRSSMLEVLSQDYVRTARAKGLRGRVVLMRHALRNALIPIVTVLGINVGILLGGSAVVETVFVLPGVGQLVVRSLYNRDLPVIQGLILYVAVIYVLVNLVVDVLYTYLDPRLRTAS
jgi:peptide/nickel transport system permease protein